jgi:hypothetical protein
MARAGISQLAFYPVPHGTTKTRTIYCHCMISLLMSNSPVDPASGSGVLAGAFLHIHLTENPVARETRQLKQLIIYCS